MKISITIQGPRIYFKVHVCGGGGGGGGVGGEWEGGSGGRRRPK